MHWCVVYKKHLSFHSYSKQPVEAQPDLNSRTSICSNSVLFTTPFTHLCFCRGGSDAFRESDGGFFSPMLSCYFPGSFVWFSEPQPVGSQGTERNIRAWGTFMNTQLTYLGVCHLVFGLTKYLMKKSVIGLYRKYRNIFMSDVKKFCIILIFQCC